MLQLETISAETFFQGDMKIGVLVILGVIL